MPNLKQGLKINRVFTKKENNLLEKIEYEMRTSEIIGENGKEVFKQTGVEVPKSWSQVATDILAQKYFRKSGAFFDKAGNPIKLSSDEEALTLSKEKDQKEIKEGEYSIKQVAHRLAGSWADWGERYGYFNSEEDKSAFYDELKYMIISQICAPNSPQWFNTGLNFVYGIKGTPQGHYYVDEIVGKMKHTLAMDRLKLSEDSYSRPQPHACFIQGVNDDLVGDGGIFDLLTRETRIFKYGSGTGTNFSKIRGKGEKLSGGGTSSGLMSFLTIFDKAAGSIKSGGTTRRAAKMVCLNLDHPEIMEFIKWKSKEERKVADLYTGSHLLHKTLKEIIESYEVYLNKDTTENKNKFLGLIKSAKDLFVPLNYIKRILMLTEMNAITSKTFTYEVYDTDFRSESYQTVDGQNSNNSIRINDEFMRKLENNDEDWNLIARTTGEVVKTIKTSDIWNEICKSAWESADPGVQFDTIINDWHTCPNDGRINASNPCSEYMFLDETACNLASINLDKFYDSKKRVFDYSSYLHTIRLWTIVLEISVLMSQSPSSMMAVRTYQYRTLGLGYANLGTILMKAGLPYDSNEARGITAVLTSIMTAEAYRTSAEMSEILGAFERFENNRDQMLRVIRNHRRATYAIEKNQNLKTTMGEYEGLSIKPFEINEYYVPKYLLDIAKSTWDKALEEGEKYGYRNAQVTVIAPTGTIGLVMDCDTTGIEPDFSLIKFKKLVGGGYFKLVNTSVTPALENLGYTVDQIKDIIKYIDTESTYEGSPHLKLEHYAVFDCANKNGAKGVRFIEPMGHIKILAAAQPFVSGSISKTINLPEVATIQDISDIYKTSWKLGLKCNALYRDSSKLSQPLTTTGNSDKFDYLNNIDEIIKTTHQVINTKPTEVIKYIQVPVKRNRLENERNSITHKFSLGGHEGYITVGLYENGKPGEIFIQMNKEGSTLSGIMDAWAITMSLALQHGVDIENLISKFVHTRFDPSGMTGNPDIPIAKSLVDYIGRWLAVKFLPLESAKLYHNAELVERIFEKREIKKSEIKLDLKYSDEMPSKPAITSTPSKSDIKAFMSINNADAPSCTTCGSIMVRNGACYKCLDCGETSGCS